MKKFGSIQRKRKIAFKKDQGFDCKCPVCLGQAPAQEKTLKKLIEQHNKLNPKPLNWKREAGLWSRIVDLTMELNIGDPLQKISALNSLLGFAHVARDRVLVKKSIDMLKQLTEEYKFEAAQKCFEKIKKDLASWAGEFSLNNAPRKEEIDFFLVENKIDELKKFSI